MDTSNPLELISSGDIGLLGPILILALWGVGVLMADLILEPDKKGFLPLFALAGLALSFFTLHMGVGSPGSGVYFYFYDCLRYDKLVFLADNVILGVAVFLVLISPRYLRDRAIPRGEYYALLLFAVIGMMTLAASNELLTLFLNLEVLSITLYALAGMERDNLRSSEAAFKYFLVGSYSAAFLLFGLTMVYGAVGTTSFPAIQDALASGAVEHPLFLTAGFSLMLVGFGFKLTLAPFHMYAPDLYAGAPTPVAAAIATGSKVAGFAAFFNFFRMIESWTGAPSGFYYGLLGLTILSILVGNVGALVQPNIKRLLAYSGVAHAGYAMIPLVAALRQTATGGESLLPQAESAIAYYLMAYALMTVLAFGVAATLGPLGESHIDRYAGLAGRSPLLAGALALALLSLTGVPLTVGFLGKFYLFSVAVKGHLYALAAFGVLASVASAYYYLRVIVKMYMEVPRGARAEPGHLENPSMAALLAGSAGIFLFAIFPMMFLLD